MAAGIRPVQAPDFLSFARVFDAAQQYRQRQFDMMRAQQEAERSAGASAMMSRALAAPEGPQRQAVEQEFKATYGPEYLKFQQQATANQAAEQQLASSSMENTDKQRQQALETLTYSRAALEAINKDPRQAMPILQNLRKMQMIDDAEFQAMTNPETARDAIRSIYGQIASVQDAMAKGQYESKFAASSASPYQRQQALSYGLPINQPKTYTDPRVVRDVRIEEESQRRGRKTPSTVINVGEGFAGIPKAAEGQFAKEFAESAKEIQDVKNIINIGGEAFAKQFSAWESTFDDIAVKAERWGLGALVPENRKISSANRATLTSAYNALGAVIRNRLIGAGQTGVEILGLAGVTLNPDMSPTEARSSVLRLLAASYRLNALQAQFLQSGLPVTPEAWKQFVEEQSKNYSARISGQGEMDTLVDWMTDQGMSENEISSALRIAFGQGGS